MPLIRYECYTRIRDYVRSTIIEYYKRYPERLGDTRSADAMEKSLKGLDGIFSILNDYEIRRKTNHESPQNK